VGGQALVQTSVKRICFRALPTQFVRKPHATTPFRTTGLATQSRGNKLSIGRPTLLTLPSIIQRQAPLLSDQANVHMAARWKKTSVVMTQLSYSGDASFFSFEIIEEIAVWMRDDEDIRLSIECWGTGTRSVTAL